MARTTSTLVIGLLPSECDFTISESTVDPYVASATVIVDRVQTCASNKGLSLTSTELELIERWLAAHFYTIMDPIYKRKKTLDSEGEFYDRSYLKAALIIDYSGCLAAIMSKRRIGIDWLGKPAGDQLTYDERN